MARIKKVDSQNKRINPMIGIPAALLPKPGQASRASANDRYELRTEGPRDLSVWPFDYRNPFPLKAWDTERSKRGSVAQWPLCNEAVEDFNYYPNDHVALGLPEGPECARLDPDGGVRVLSGAWGLGAGAEGKCLDFRIRRLEEGCLPIVTADATDAAGLQFKATWFACRIAGTAEIKYPVDHNHAYGWEGCDNPGGSNQFIVVRHEIRNPGSESSSLDLRFSFAQDAALCAAAFYTLPHWMPKIGDLAFSKMNRTTGRLTGTVDGKSVVLGVVRAARMEFAVTKKPCAYAPFLLSESPKYDPKMTVGAKLSIQPGETVTVEWVIPLFAAPVSDARVLASCSTAALESATRRFWKKHRQQGMQLLIPEDKVRNSWYQALNNLDICSVKLGRSVFPTPGPSGGHHIFYARDNVDLIYAVALAGDIERAGRMVNHYMFWKLGQEEAGMLLWLLGAMLDLSGDKDWAISKFHFVRQCAARLINDWSVNRNDPTGLLTETSICDNELAYGHFVSYHLYAVAGLKTAVRVAKLAGEQEFAADWEVFRLKLTKNIMDKLAELSRRTGGVITPTFEGYEARGVEQEIPDAVPPRKEARPGAYGEKGGVDWHNIALAFPTGVFEADDPIVSAALARWRHTYVEGVFPYPAGGDFSWLHNYNGINLSETWLRRGDWAEALRDLYGLLLHTSSTHASAEVVASALRMDHGCTPHNWFSSKLVRYIRDLLVYEGTDRRLHLLGGLAPAWMKPGMRVGVEQAPTTLGGISYVATMGRNGFELAIDWKARVGAEGLVLHLPPFLKGAVVKVKGKSIRAGKLGYPLPLNTTAVTVTWPEQEMPDLSFDAVVTAFLEDHATRAKCFRQEAKAPEFEAGADGDDPMGKSSSEAFRANVQS